MKVHIAPTWLLVFALGAAPVLAQTSQPAPSPSTKTQSQQKAKKVWTNDDLSGLSGGVTSATATLPPSDTASQASGTAANAAAPADQKLPPEKDPKVYRAKLEPLRAQLAATEAKITEIQDAIAHPIDGKNAIKLNQQAPNLPKQDQPADYQAKRPDDAIYGNQVVRPEEQLVVYQQKRDALRQQIDDLEAQARQNGLSPGDLR